MKDSIRRKVVVASLSCLTAVFASCEQGSAGKYQYNEVNLQGSTLNDDMRNLSDHILKIKSADKADRQGAFSYLINTHKTTVSQVVDTLEGTLEKEKWGLPESTEVLAIIAIRELRAEEAVPVLIKCLSKPFPPIEAGLNIAQSALIHIGLPARDPLVELIREKGVDNYEGMSALYALSMIMGKEWTRHWLQKASDSEENDDVKMRLHHAAEKVK